MQKWGALAGMEAGGGARLLERLRALPGDAGEEAREHAQVLVWRRKSTRPLRASLPMATRCPGTWGKAAYSPTPPTTHRRLHSSFAGSGKRALVANMVAEGQASPSVP